MKTCSSYNRQGRIVVFPDFIVFLYTKISGSWFHREKGEPARENENRLVIHCIKNHLKQTVPSRLTKISRFDYQPFSDKCLICLQTRKTARSEEPDQNHKTWPWAGQSQSRQPNSDSSSYHHWRVINKCHQIIDDGYKVCTGDLW